MLPMMFLTTSMMMMVVNWQPPTLPMNDHMTGSIATQLQELLAALDLELLFLLKLNVSKHT
jgi:hypothetical protein